MNNITENAILEGFEFGFMGLDMNKNKSTTRILIDTVALLIDGNNNNNCK